MDIASPVSRPRYANQSAAAAYYEIVSQKFQLLMPANNKMKDMPYSLNILLSSILSTIIGSYLTPEVMIRPDPSAEGRLISNYLLHIRKEIRQIVADGRSTGEFPLSSGCRSRSLISKSKRARRETDPATLRRPGLMNGCGSLALLAT